jgi:hypothetical protein
VLPQLGHAEALSEFLSTMDGPRTRVEEGLVAQELHVVRLRWLRNHTYCGSTCQTVLTDCQLCLPHGMHCGGGHGRDCGGGCGGGCGSDVEAMLLTVFISYTVIEIIKY